jgi:5'-nucleotidase
MRVLVTNDDGVHAPGIVALACAMREAMFDVIMVAPRGEMSGSSASMAAHNDEIHYARVAVDGWADPAYALDGAPALCVIAGVLGAFGPPPDIIVAGVNPGLNTGRSTLHSGTIGAALTAAAWGLSGLAVSIDIGSPTRWGTATDLACQAAVWLARAPKRTAINLNVPNLEPRQLRGVRHATLAPLGAMRTSIAEHTPGLIKLQLLPNTTPVPHNTDTAIVRDGYATVSLLTPPAAIDDASVLEAFDSLGSSDGVR